MVQQIFVNLPVKDLERSKAFFAELGFGFKDTFTNDKAACLVLGENFFAMLITEPFFKTFMNRDIADTTKTAEVITALQVESVERVNQLADAALAAGATEFRKPEDHGFMYIRTFTDPEGHLWEVFVMNMDKFPKT